MVRLRWLRVVRGANYAISPYTIPPWQSPKPEKGFLFFLLKTLQRTAPPVWRATATTDPFPPPCPGSSSVALPRTPTRLLSTAASSRRAARAATAAARGGGPRRRTTRAARYGCQCGGTSRTATSPTASTSAASRRGSRPPCAPPASAGPSPSPPSATCSSSRAPRRRRSPPLEFPSPTSHAVA
jgi:hypothetical protein